MCIKKIVLAVAILLVIGITGCKNNNVTKDLATVKPTTITATSTKKEINMEYVINSLKNNKLPIVDVINYTAENDKNKLLGRPGQYIAKSDFWDSRIDHSEENYCTVEIFKDELELIKRKNYLDGIIKSDPMFLQYMYNSKTVLLRLPSDMTPTMAEEYKKILENIE